MLNRLLLATVGSGAFPPFEEDEVFHGARVFRTTSQNLTNNDYTKVAFTATDYDTDGYLDGDELVIPAGLGGYYDIFGAISAGTDPDGQRIVIITRNAGASVDGSTEILVPVGTGSPGSGGNTHESLSSIRILEEGDAIALWVYQSSGGTLSLDVGSNPGDYVPSLGIAYRGAV